MGRYGAMTWHHELHIKLAQIFQCFNPMAAVCLPHIGNAISKHQIARKQNFFLRKIHHHIFWRMRKAHGLYQKLKATQLESLGSVDPLIRSHQVRVVVNPRPQLFP